ncbi:DUF4177 domain-containing protein, partial [Dysosmobacter welbionis]
VLGISCPDSQYPHVLLKLDTADLGAQQRLRRRGAGGGIQQDAGLHNGPVVIYLVHILQPKDIILHL